MSLNPLKFAREHRVTTRLDSAIGRELSQVERDTEELTLRFTHDGTIDMATIHLLRTGLDRLEMHSKLVALAQDLEERAGVVGRLVDRLGEDHAPGAIERVQAQLERQLDEIHDIASTAV